MLSIRSTKRPRITQPPIQTPVDPDLFRPKANMANRLPTALAMYGNSNLLGKTVLDRDIHEQHSSAIEQSLMNKILESHSKKNEEIRKWNSSSSSGQYFQIQELSLEEFVERHVRFATFLYEVVELYPEAILRSVNAMRKDIQDEARKMTKEVDVLGAAEVELISIPLLEAVNSCLQSKVDKTVLDDCCDPGQRQKLIDAHSKSKLRKLDVCKALDKPNSPTIFSGDYTKALVHFHGIIIFKSASSIEKFRSRLRQIDKFDVIQHQIEIKQLSKFWGDKPRTVQDNIYYISRYLTKGSASRTNLNEANYKFKVKFDHGDLVTSDQMESLELMDQQVVDLVKSTGTVHELRTDLSKSEISILCEVIDKMMFGTSSGYGYLISKGSWSLPKYTRTGWGKKGKKSRICENAISVH